MSEIISELNNLHINLRREDLDSSSSKEKDELQHNELLILMKHQHLAQIQMMGIIKE